MIRSIILSFISLAALAGRAVESGSIPAERFTPFADPPLYFEANHGQAGDSAQFIARGRDCTVLIAPTEAVLVLDAHNETEPLSRWERINRDRPDLPLSRTLRIHLAGANPQAKLTATERLAGKVNYFVGNNPAEWHAGVPLFGKVQIESAYRGIQLAYYGKERQLEYDFLLRPGSTPDQISLQIEGADEVEVDNGGNLVLKIDDIEVRQHKPVIYQVRQGKKIEISGGYRLTGRAKAGFWVGDYDQSLPLVIDPTLSFSTYLGGNKDDEGWGVAVDGSGNVYVAGSTVSHNLLTNAPPGSFQTNFQGGTAAFGDAFVAKYDSTGSLVYLTYLGGRGQDGAYAIAADPAGDAFITGYTSSPNFPVQPPDALQPKIAGQNNNGQHIFPIDAFVTRLDPSGGNLIYSTYLGGNGRDTGMGIAVDSLDNAYITGFTESTNFPTTNFLAGPYVRGKFDGTVTNYAGNKYHYGRGDAFVSKISPDGRTLLYSSYLGGTNQENGEGIAVDSAFSAYVVGWTFSTNFPTTNPTNNVLNYQTGNFSSFASAFICKLSVDGQSLVYALTLGGDHNDAALHVAVDTANNAYITGYTYSTNFPITITNFFAVFPGTTNAPLQLTNPVAFVSRTNVNSDVFVTKLDPSGTTNGGYSVVFGGKRNDQGNGIDVDAGGNVYVAGMTASFTNFAGINPGVFSNYFTAPGAFGFNPTNNSAPGSGTNDAFVVELDPTGSNFLFFAFIGGKRNDQANGIAFDQSANAAYIVGTTVSTNFPVTNAVQSRLSSKRKTDAFVGRIQFP